MDTRHHRSGVRGSPGVMASNPNHHSGKEGMRKDGSQGTLFGKCPGACSSTWLGDGELDLASGWQSYQLKSHVYQRLHRPVRWNKWDLFDRLIRRFDLDEIYSSDFMTNDEKDRWTELGELMVNQCWNALRIIGLPLSQTTLGWWKGFGWRSR